MAFKAALARDHQERSESAPAQRAKIGQIREAIQVITMMVRMPSRAPRRARIFHLGRSKADVVPSVRRKERTDLSYAVTTNSPNARWRRDCRHKVSQEFRAGSWVAHCESSRSAEILDNRTGISSTKCQEN